MLMHKSQYHIHVYNILTNHAWRSSLLNTTHCTAQEFMDILLLKRNLKVIVQIMTSTILCRSIYRESHEHMYMYQGMYLSSMGSYFCCTIILFCN